MAHGLLLFILSAMHNFANGVSNLLYHTLAARPTVHPCTRGPIRYPPDAEWRTCHHHHHLCGAVSTTYVRHLLSHIVTWGSAGLSSQQGSCPDLLFHGDQQVGCLSYKNTFSHAGVVTPKPSPDSAQAYTTQALKTIQNTITKITKTEKRACWFWFFF